MRIGMHLPQFRERVDAGLVLEAAAAAEDAALDDVWVSDHVLLPADSDRPPTSFHDALTVLTYAAATTTRVGLGTSVLVAPYRSPVVLARAITTLDALSGGRVVLGIASGWLREEFDAVGASWECRGALTDEAIDLCRSLWGGSGHSTGPASALVGMRLEPGPARAGGPPIWVGGNSEAGVRRAARRGDAWHTTISDPERLTPKIAALGEAAVVAGRDPGAVPVTVRVRARALEVAELAPRLAALGVAHLLVDLRGTDPGRFATDAPLLRQMADAG